LYQLRTDGAFAGADFFALFDDDQKVLGPELISRDEFVLAPTEQAPPWMSRSRARPAMSVPSQHFVTFATRNGGVLVPASKSALNLAIERARIVITVAAN
jgi:hypothetical protein